MTGVGVLGVAGHGQRLPIPVTPPLLDTGSLQRPKEKLRVVEPLT